MAIGLSNIARGSESGPAALAAEIARRASLAREPQPEDVSVPRTRLFLNEIGSIVSAPFRRVAPFEVAPAARPRPVMLLPGFATHPYRMRFMARQLEKAGHTVKRWGLGFNWGPTCENFAALEGRLLDLACRHGEPVVLVGWSLGGIYARELAKNYPESVAKVITMGTPFSGSPRGNNAWRLYHLVCGHRVEEPPIEATPAEKPPVPTVAMWSPRDGIVHARCACGKPDERDRAIAVRCAHVGFSDSEEVIRAILAELDMADSAEAAA